MTDLVQLPAAVIAEAVSRDDLLRAQVGRVVGGYLQFAEEVLAVGAHPQKMAVLKAVVPATLRELREEQRDESIEQLRAEIAELNATIRAGIGAVTVNVAEWDDEAVPVDVPPSG